jgi:hypothetical protein
MPDKAIRVYTQHWTANDYQEAVANGDTPAPTDETGEPYLIKDWAETYGGWNDDDTVWIPATDVDTAALLLTGHTTHFWASTCSDTGPSVTTKSWYENEYADHYTGDMTSKTAHLEGDWSDQEATEIRAQVLGR